MLHQIRTKSYFLNQIFWFSPWKRPFCICTALLMVDRPTGTQSWQLSRSELVIQRHSPPTSIPLSYYLLLILYSEKSRTTSNQLALLKSLSFPPQVSVSVKFPFTQPQTCRREAILSLCLSSPSLLPSIIRPCPQISPSVVKAAPLTPVSPQSSPSSEPLSQASRDGCIGLARSPFRLWQPR